MKNSMSLYALCAALLGLLIMAESAQAKDLNSEMNSLGTSQQVKTRANRLNPHNKVKIVQQRLVDRNLRLEVVGQYGPVANGDSYINTQQYGAGLEFHIIPQLSLGARYLKDSNQFTSEGKAQISNAATNPNATFPATDRADYQVLGTASYYFMYGKLNMFDLGVTQFDIYAIGGGGQIKLESGTAPTYTAGVGIGFWWNQHFTSRLEARYQGYSDQVYPGSGQPLESRQMNLLVATAGIGFLL